MIRNHTHRGRWIAATVTCVAAIALLAGAASACDVPATATEVCAPDNHHWEASVTITNKAPWTYTVESATLDTTAWAPDAVVTSLATGTVLQTGESTTFRAVGIPLSTGGAVITYVGRYSTGKEISYGITLYRPYEQCEVATTTTTVAELPSSTVESTTTTTTAAPSSTTTQATTTTTAVPGSAAPKIIGWVESTTTEAPAEVLAAEETSSTSTPQLASTGAGSTGQLVIGAFLLVIVGLGLVTVVMTSPSDDDTRHGRRLHH